MQRASTLRRQPALPHLRTLPLSGSPRALRSISGAGPQGPATNSQSPSARSITTTSTPRVRSRSSGRNKTLTPSKSRTLCGKRAESSILPKRRVPELVPQRSLHPTGRGCPSRIPRNRSTRRRERRNRSPVHSRERKRIFLQRDGAKPRRQYLDYRRRPSSAPS